MIRKLGREVLVAIIVQLGDDVKNCSNVQSRSTRKTKTVKTLSVLRRENRKACVRTPKNEEDSKRV